MCKVTDIQLLAIVITTIIITIVCTVLYGQKGATHASCAPTASITSFGAEVWWGGVGNGWGVFEMLGETSQVEFHKRRVWAKTKVQLPEVQPRALGQRKNK